MKKEVILAISVGFALGLVITFGIWTANKSLRNLPEPKTTPTPAPVSETPKTTNSSLVITSPDDEFLTNSDTVTVSGKATPNATIIIVSEDDQISLQADAAGSFSKEINLITGFNNITVYAYDTTGNETSQKLTITYTTAKI